MTTHKLKCWPQCFDVIKRGEKTFEARKDDRGFQRGDRVVLMETYPNYPYNVKPAPIGFCASFACVFVVLAHFERLKRIEDAVDRMEARLNADEEEDDDEAE